MSSYHLYHDILLFFCRCFAIAYVCCWCFTIACVCYPTFILNIIVRCDVLSSELWCLAIFSMLPCYLLVDVSPWHMFVADVSPSCMFVILPWFSISLLGVMFYHLDCLCLVVFAMIFCYLFADVSPSHMFVIDVSPSRMFFILPWF